MQCQIFEVKHGRPLYFYCVQTCNNIAAWLDKSINWANSFFSCDWFFFSVQICNNILANAATPSIVYCCTWLYVSRTFWQFCTKSLNVNLAQNDVQKYVDASSGYNCTFLCSPACFSPASARSFLSLSTKHPSPPQHADCHAAVALMRGTRARWFVPWHGFSSCRIHPQLRLYCQLYPLLLLHHCQFSHIYLWPIDKHNWHAK